jgi:adenylate cyclase
MGVETERKFLLADSAWRLEVTRTLHLRQGFLSTDLERVVRVRLVDDETGYLTVKGRRVEHRRPEFEYRIPAEDAAFMLDHLCIQPVLAKRRHVLGGRAPGEWIVDEFEAENEGLIVCEVEYEEGDEFDLPAWMGEDVSEDDRYANSSLQRSPYTTW